MHAQDLVGTRGRCAKDGDRDRRGIGREQRGGPRQRVESREQRALGVGLFDDRLDDVVGVGEGVERGGCHDTAQGSVAGRRRELSLLDQSGEAFFDRVPRAVEHRLRDVHQPHDEARLREDLGDAVAHRARADDAYGFESSVVLRSDVRRSTF